MSEDSELRHLLNGLLEGSLSPSETQRVGSILRQSAEARQEYYDLVAVDLMLAEHYGMPEHIAMHAQVMSSDAGAPSARPGWQWRGSWTAGGIAAAVALGAGLFFMRDTRQHDVPVVVSPDGHYEINDSAVSSGVLRSGDTISVRHGAVSLALAPGIDATLEGPAVLRLGERAGKVELVSGSAFFSVTGHRDRLEVHSPSGIIRDIGTRFGVSVLPDGLVETHVEEGLVEIQRTDIPNVPVTAGYTASWAGSGPVTSSQTSGSWVRVLPGETPLLSESFNDGSGEPISGRVPKIGQRWECEPGHEPARLQDGWFDTSGGSRTVSAGFQPGAPAGSVYLVTFRTRPPAAPLDEKAQPDAEESITLRDADGNPLVSLVARASRHHSWQIKNCTSSELSTGTRIVSSDESTLTLSLDRRTGAVRLYLGGSTQGQFLDELPKGLQSDAAPASICVSNSLGGDLALDELVVRMVTYGP